MRLTKTQARIEELEDELECERSITNTALDRADRAEAEADMLRQTVGGMTWQLNKAIRVQRYLLLVAALSFVSALVVVLLCV